MIGARYRVAGIHSVRKTRERLSDNSADSPSPPQSAGYLGMRRGLVQHLARGAALLGVLQNDTAPMVIDHSPFLDLLQGSKAAETSIVVVQTAIADARRLSQAVDITHWSSPIAGLRI